MPADIDIKGWHLQLAKVLNIQMLRSHAAGFNQCGWKKTGNLFLSNNSRIQHPSWPLRSFTQQVGSLATALLWLVETEATKKQEGSKGPIVSKPALFRVSNPAFFILDSGHLTSQWKMHPLKMYFLLKMVIFHCYVSLPEGSWLNSCALFLAFFVFSHL